MKNSQHVDADVIKAGKLIRSGRSAEAIPILTAYLARYPDDVWACSERAYAKKFTGDLLGALEDRTEIVRLAPLSPNSFTGRGIAHADAGHLREAIDDFTTALQLDPTLTRAHIFRGRVKVKLGELKSALIDFTAAIDDQQTGPGSGLINRGRVHYLLGDFDAAVQDFTTALESVPFTCTHSALYRGIARQATEDYAKAIADFTMAIDSFPGLSNAYRHRASAKQSIGDTSGSARDMLEYERLGGVDLPAYALSDD